MKKIISSTILGILVASFLVISPIQAQENTTTAVTATNASIEGLEKIPSPEEIKNFRVMKKIGNALYGIRKTNTNQKPTTTPANKPTENKLEKIPAPAMIKLYDKIRQVGNALWGIRKQPTANSLIVTETASECVAAAIDTKDKSLIEKADTVTAELSVAISARSTCQQTAIKSTANQKENLTACTETFRETHKNILTNAKSEQKKIWDTYKDALKICTKTLISSSTDTAATEGEIMIEDGSETIMNTLTDASQE